MNAADHTSEVELLSIPQAIAELPLSIRSGRLRAAINCGAIPSVCPPPGKRKLVRRGDLRRWMCTPAGDAMPIIKTPTLNREGVRPYDDPEGIVAELLGEKPRRRPAPQRQQGGRAVR